MPAQTSAPTARIPPNSIAFSAILFTRDLISICHTPHVLTHIVPLAQFLMNDWGSPFPTTQLSGLAKRFREIPKVKKRKRNDEIVFIIH